MKHPNHAPMNEATTDGMVPSIEKNEEMDLWVFRYFRFVRVNRSGKHLPMRSSSMLPNAIPILAVNFLIMGAVAIAVLYFAMSVFSSFRRLHDEDREDRARERFDTSHLWTGNGGFPQERANYEKFETRIGERRLSR